MKTYLVRSTIEGDDFQARVRAENKSEAVRPWVCGGCCEDAEQGDWKNLYWTPCAAILDVTRIRKRLRWKGRRP